jgi:hypothetical protein
VGLESNSTENNFLVFPVPNEGLFKISAECHCGGMLTMSVFNDLGAKVQEIRDDLKHGRYDGTVDLRPLAAGIYSIVFRCNDNITVKRIIVTNR